MIVCIEKADCFDATPIWLTGDETRSDWFAFDDSGSRKPGDTNRQPGAGGPGADLLDGNFETREVRRLRLEVQTGRYTISELAGMAAEAYFSAIKPRATLEAAQIRKRPWVR